MMAVQVWARAGWSVAVFAALATSSLTGCGDFTAGDIECFRDDECDSGFVCEARMCVAAGADAADDVGADAATDAEADIDADVGTPDAGEDAAVDAPSDADATDVADATLPDASDTFDVPDLPDVPVDPELLPPTGVSASDGTSPTSVTLTWEPVEGADGYRVFRDGVGIADVEAPPWDDDGASRGVPGAVSGLSASSDDALAVRVMWSPVTTTSIGDTHVYTVATLRGDASSEPSSGEPGFTGAGAVAGYDLQVDGAIVSLGSTTYTDGTAPAPTVTVGAITATWDGAAMQLRAVGAGASAGAERSYRVRTRATAGGASPWSAGVTGRRIVDGVSYAWERSTADRDRNYELLTSTATGAATDPGGPPAGEGRYYRVTVSADGAESVTTAGVRSARPEDPVPAAPTGVQASDGTSAEHVTVTWSPVSGATSYDVYRDGALAESGVTDTSWQDVDATEGAAPAAPGGVAASTDRTGEVRVTWNPAAQGSAGSVHSYTVAARNSVGAGARSTANTGYRAAPTITGYQVSVNSGAWQSADPSTPGSWDDTAALAGTVNGGTASASDGTSSTYVSLSLSGASASPGATRSYRVRATASDGRDGTTSGSVSGRRAVGTLMYQWQRTSSDSVSGTWSDLSGATFASHNDSTAPSDGSGRWYRCVVSASGAVGVVSTEDRGSRTSPVPAAPTGVQASDGTSVEHVTVTWSAVSGATSYDVYRDSELAASGVEGTSWHDAEAEQGAAPAAPSGVSASTDRTGEVRVSWNAAAQGSAGSAHSYTVAARNSFGAGSRSSANTGYRTAPTVTGYQVSVNSGAWQSAGMSSERSWNDTSAPAGTVSGGAASASDGTSSRHVSLSLSGASASPGATQSYRVRAVASDGRDGTTSGSVSGRRAVGTLSYQWQRTSSDSTSGTWSNLSGPTATSPSHEDTSAPSDGSGRYYRCEVSAAGAVSDLSTTDRGYRSVGISPLGATCSSGTTCDSGFCGNGRCAPEGFSYIAPGTFTMGSPTSEVGRGSDETQHSVTLTRAFFLQQTEVTQGQWRTLMGNNPSSFAGCGDDCPVDTVNWYEALAYANALSDAEGLSRCYTLTGCSNTPRNGMECTGVSVTAAGGNPLLCEGYRLPTESEWEYAARAGTTTATYRGNLQSPTGCDPQPNLEPIAWYCENSSVAYVGAYDCSTFDGPSRCGTRAVATRASSSWGLYDMLGNVSEWCWDLYGTYPGPVTDPLGASSGGRRMLRGGVFGGGAQFARAAMRVHFGPGYRYNGGGFRLARSVP